MLVMLGRGGCGTRRWLWCLGVLVIVGPLVEGAIFGWFFFLTKECNAKPTSQFYR